MSWMLIQFTFTLFLGGFNFYNENEIYRENAENGLK